MPWIGGPAPLPRRLRDALPEAIRSGDRAAVSALRAALAALDNAGAVELPAGTGAGAIERSPVGVGAAEVPRRELSEADCARLVRAEIAEREAVAAEYERAARPENAERLRREAAVLAAFLA